MNTDFTDQEKKALETKLENPREDVVCPRCGQMLKYREVGNSCEVKCPTKDCLYASIRGI